MRTKLFILVVILLLLSTAGIILSQLFWIRNSIRQSRINQDALITISMNKALNEYYTWLKNNHDTDFQMIKANETDKGQLNKNEAQYQQLGTFLHHNLSEAGLSDQFNYAFSYQDQVIYSSQKLTDSIYLKSYYTESIYCTYCPTGTLVHLVFSGNKANTELPIESHSKWIWIGLLSVIFEIFASVFLIVIIIKADRRTKVRIDMINNLAHEFKTPISSIKLASDILLNEEVYGNPIKVKKYAGLIKFENERLKQHSDLVHNLVLLEEKQITVRYSYFNVNETIQQLIEFHSMVRPEMGERIKITQQADNPFINSDQGHFENVILNLIENAFKYGGDHICVKVSTGNKNNGVMLRVEDDGIGIHRKHHQLIFKKYFRVSTGNKQTASGFGIGLYYVKTILAQLGGNIHLHSSPGKGTRFDIYLPFNRTND